MVAPARPILLVEDDPNDILLIRRAFLIAKVGAPLQVVHNADGAVAYLAGREPYADRNRFPPPLLMLLDLRLPGNPGFGVLAWLQQQDGLQAPPVVVLTADGKPADILRAYKLGACAFYVKPASFAALLDLLKVLLRDFPELREPCPKLVGEQNLTENRIEQTAITATCKTCGWMGGFSTLHESRRHLFRHWALTSHEDLWASDAKYDPPAEARDMIEELRRRGLLVDEEGSGR